MVTHLHIPTAIEIIERALFEAVDMPTDCGDCESLTKLPDIHATGDSPDEYNCSSCPQDCPVVMLTILKIGVGYEDTRN